ncbi:hypothetical protein [Paenibacillus yanchengensis]|uniref:Nucleotidyl transferase AbiEii/AbiGii toxin family protein n=1 Tax=Paenibacillus yanchengensis TaxID=2035833 RepID=A0ABW4YJQ6_9BACL
MESALIYDAIAILVNRLDDAKHTHPWVIGGSTALMLRGLALTPRDIDIYCDLNSVNFLCERLNDYMVEAPNYSVTNIYSSTLARFQIAGVSVELVGDFTVRTACSSYHIQVEQLLSPYSDTITVPACTESTALPLVPLAHELLFNYLRGREDRLLQVTSIFQKQYNTHFPAFKALVGANVLSEADRIHLHRIIAI